jgi:prefoldin beta subunit
MKVSSETQELFSQFQIAQQQMQSIMAQREGMSIQSIESDKALEELTKSQETHVYKAVGSILVRVKKEDVQKELEERKETAELRIKSLDKEEKRLREKMMEMQKKLQQNVGSAE